MLELIEAARARVRFENFIFAGDATGRRFAEALGTAAQRGVDVRVLYDPIGTLMVRGGSIARTLRGSGADVRPFRPLSPYAPWTWTRLRHRDHRKTLCVDGESAVVGGLCISDNWSPSSRGGHGWRDTALQVGGAVVEDVERAFDAMWRDEAGLAVGGPAAAREAVVSRALMVGADRPNVKRIARLYTWLAEKATRSIDITDAYLVLSAHSLQLLAAAARRGGSSSSSPSGPLAARAPRPRLDRDLEVFDFLGFLVPERRVRFPPPPPSLQ
jgi:phosphatidylserine/phosphatidylglycerophosphate/cardiolipin synthase-like enzyme